MPLTTALLPRVDTARVAGQDCGIMGEDFGADEEAVAVSPFGCRQQHKWPVWHPKQQCFVEGSSYACAQFLAHNRRDFVFSAAQLTCAVCLHLLAAQNWRKEFEDAYFRDCQAFRTVRLLSQFLL